MNDNELKKLNEELNNILPEDKLDKLEKELTEKIKMKEKNALEDMHQKLKDAVIQEIAQNIKPLMKGVAQEKLLEALSNIRIESAVNVEMPQVNLQVPEMKATEVTVNIPEIQMPAINVPQIKMPAIEMPKIEIPPITIPEIKVPDVQMPDKIKVDGFKEFVKTIVKILKERAETGGLESIDAKHPLPVIITDDKFYKALLSIGGGGGGVSIVQLKDATNVVISPATEATLTLVKIAVESIAAAQGSVDTPVIANVTLTNANTEYTQALAAGTKRFMFQCRSAVDTRYAFETGKVAAPTAPYFTLKGGGSYAEDGINFASGATLFFASATAGVVMEITYWT